VFELAERDPPGECVFETSRESRGRASEEEVGQYDSAGPLLYRRIGPLDVLG
jgi:hypothetical protein